MPRVLAYIFLLMQGIHWLKVNFVSGSAKGRYASGLDALQEHFEYIFRKGETTATAEQLNGFLDFAKEKIKKRKDSRIAVKLMLALPNDLQSFDTERRLSIAQSMIGNFVERALGISRQDMVFVLHNDAGNLHAHVVCKAQRKDGKPVKYAPHELKAMHRTWNEILQEWNVDVYRLQDYAEEKVNITLPYRSYHATGLKEVRKAIRSEAMQIREKQRQQVNEHIRLLHGAGNTFFVVAINPSKGSVIERKVRGGISDGLLGYLRHLNAQGYNIYISMNAYKEDAKDRKAENVKEEQAVIYFDIDGDKHGKDGLELLQEMMQRFKLPKPSLTVRTSAKNLQVIYKLRNAEDRAKLEKIMRVINKAMGFDATQDASRVFRLAGFKDKKRDKDFVSIMPEWSTKKEYSLEELLIGIAEYMAKHEAERKSREQEQRHKVVIPTPKTDAERPESRGYGELAKAFCKRLGIGFAPPQTDDESVIDWALAKRLAEHLSQYYAGQELVKEVEAMLTEFLQSSRPDKIARNRGYARLTAEKAVLETEQNKRHPQGPTL